MTATWLVGVLRRRAARMAATAIGVGVAVALVASIGAFLSATTARMTARAIARIPVDWQVEAAPGANPTGVLASVRHQPGVVRALPVSFTRTAGFSATTQGSTQATGPGRVLGLPPGYARAFPAYVIHPHRLEVKGNQVAILGHTTGSHLGLPDAEESKLTLIWIAGIEGDRVASWTLVEDTLEHRRAFGLDS